MQMLTRPICTSVCNLTFLFQSRKYISKILSSASSEIIVTKAKLRCSSWAHIIKFHQIGRGHPFRLSFVAKAANPITTFLSGCPSFTLPGLAGNYQLLINSFGAQICEASSGAFYPKDSRMAEIQCPWYCLLIA